MSSQKIVIVIEFKCWNIRSATSFFSRPHTPCDSEILQHLNSMSITIFSELILIHNAEIVEDIDRSVRNTYEDMVKRDEKWKQADRRRYNKGREGRQFKEGEQVLLWSPVVTVGNTRKFTSMWRGPYQVIEVMPNGLDFKIQHLYSQESPIKIVHGNRLRVFEQRRDEPIAVQEKLQKREQGILDAEWDQKADDLFEVEAIVGKRVDKKGRIFYRVRWSGFSPRDDTYEPMENLLGVPEEIQRFEAQRSAQKKRSRRSSTRKARKRQRQRN